MWILVKHNAWMHALHMQRNQQPRSSRPVIISYNFHYLFRFNTRYLSFFSSVVFMKYSNIKKMKRSFFMSTKREKKKKKSQG